MIDDRLRELADCTQMRPNTADPVDWTTVRNDLGFDPPSDYRALVDNFGAGTFGDYFQVFGPGHPFYPLGDHDIWDEVFKEDWGWKPDTAPTREGARNAKVVRWGGTEDAHILVWLVEPDRDPGEWLIGLQSHDGPECEYFEMTTVVFLLAWVQGDLESGLLRSFDPSEEIVYERWEELWPKP